MHCDFLNGATHVLRSSHLAEDLELLLRLAAFERPSLVRELPPVHGSLPHIKDRAELPEELAERLRQVDNFDGLAFPLVAG